MEVIMWRILIVIAAVACLFPVSRVESQDQSAVKSVAGLLSDGYEIKSTAAINVGIILMLQNKTKAYICFDTQGPKRTTIELAADVKTTPCAPVSQ
jgi:hypothetical protein